MENVLTPSPPQNSPIFMEELFHQQLFSQVLKSVFFFCWNVTCDLGLIKGQNELLIRFGLESVSPDLG